MLNHRQKRALITSPFAKSCDHRHILLRQKKRHHHGGQQLSDRAQILNQPAAQCVQSDRRQRVHRHVRQHRAFGLACNRRHVVCFARASSTYFSCVSHMCVLFTRVPPPLTTATNKQRKHDRTNANDTAAPSSNHSKHHATSLTPPMTIRALFDRRRHVVDISQCNANRVNVFWSPRHY